VKGLLIGLVILAGLGAVADYLLKQQAEARIASEVADTLEIGSDPDIQIEGFPFLLSAIRGRFSAVEVTADSLRKEGVRLDDFNARFEDLRFELSAVMSGKGDIEAARGSGSAVLPIASLNRLLSREGSFRSPLRIIGTEGQRITIDSEASSWGPVEVKPRLEDRTIVFDLVELGTASVDLPRVTSGLDYESLEIRDGRVVLTFSLSESALQLAG
jgi:LmeA-like phospholipid-binding